MLNHIVVMGRLTKDPELRRTQNGTAVASFSLACDRDYKPEGGERETDFVDCVAWRGTAEFVQKYFSKGRMAVVAGRLQIRPWTDKDGNKRRSAEIVAENVYFGDSKRDGDGGYTSSAAGAAPSPRGEGYGGYPQPQGYSYPQTGNPPAPAGYASAQQSVPTAPPAMAGMELYDEDNGLPF